MATVARLPKRTGRRWFQFSLGALLGVVTATGIWLGWFVRSVNRQREALAVIAEAGGDVLYRHQLEALERKVPPVLPGSDWLRQSLGDDYFVNPVKVQIYKDQATDAVLAEFPKLPYLDELLIQGPFTGAGLKHLDKLPRLISLAIYESAITDDDLRHVGRLKQLEILYLDSPQVTDDGLVHLRDLRRLKMLSLGGRFSDAGMHHLQALASLERLTCVSRPDLHRKLTEPSLVEFVDVSVADGLEYLQVVHKTSFRIDTAALGAAGLDTKQLLVTGLHRASLRDILKTILSPHHLDWTTDETHIVITTAQAAEESRPGIRELRRTLPKLKQVEIDW